MTLSIFLLAIRIKMKILLLEDDEFICKEIKNYFELNNNRVDYYFNGEDLLDNAILENYDIFLFDINTPKKDGFQTLKEIREKNILIPAIYISAQDDIEHVKEGYSCGCSDYIRKPFILDEVELRINQILHKDNYERVQISEKYFFDLSNMNLYENSKIIDLKIQEKDLLYLLVKNIGNTIDSEIIKNYVWSDKNICDNTLRTQIKKIRNKFDKNFIINIRNLGYKIEKHV